MGHISRRRRTKTALACSPPKRIIHINIRQGIFFHEIKYNMDISLKLLFFHGHSKHHHQHHQAKWIGTSSPLKNDNPTDRPVAFIPAYHSTPMCVVTLLVGSASASAPPLPCPAWPSFYRYYAQHTVASHPHIPLLLLDYFTQYPHSIYTSSEGCKRTTFPHKCPIN